MKRPNIIRQSPTRKVLVAVLAAGIAFPSMTSGAAAQGTDRFNLVIAATTDVHGRLRGWDYYANVADPAHSLASAATIIDSLRHANPGRVVLVDAGDLLQGNPLTFVAAKVRETPVHPAIAVMNVMQYDAAVVGNHEFNYGVPSLRRAIAQASFPFLAANLQVSAGKAFAAPSTIVTRSAPRGGTVRIGIVGGTTPGSMVWDAENLRAAKITVNDIVPAVRSAVADVKKRGADVVVVLLHSGLNETASYDTIATGLPSENVAARVAREVSGIDLVVFGHSHRELIDTLISNTLVIQPRNWATTVGVATLSVERLKGSWRVSARHGASVTVAGHAEAPAVLSAISTTHAATLAWANAPVGRTTFAWRSDSARIVDMPITDLVNEVMRRASGAQLSATAAFTLDASFEPGPITVAAISKLYPYDNTLRALKVSGAQVRAFLEHAARYYRSLDANGRAPANGLVDNTVPGYNFDVMSGADYVIDLSKPIGSRITTLSINGRAVQPADTFTLALNNYRAGGGGGYAMLSGAPVVFNKDVDVRQLLIDEVKALGDAGKSLDPALYAHRNWHIEPAGAIEIAVREQTRGRAAEAAGGRPTSRPAIRTVRVIAFSDFHAALRAREDSSGHVVGGATALSAAIARAERECVDSCASVVVHAGDLFTGTPASDWAAGTPTVAVMNRMHVAAGALGNHEFDFGQDTLRMRMGELQHRLLAINLRDNSGRMPSWIRGDTVVERSGVRVGIVGAAGTLTPATSKRRNVANLTFLEPAPLMSDRIAALRAQGAQIVIGVIHDGGRCTGTLPADCRGSGLDVARQLTAKPDAFVIGHSHLNVNTRINGFPVVEPASSGRALQIIDVPLDGSVASMILRTVTDDTVGAHAGVDSIVRAAVGRVAERLNRPIATFAQAMPHRGAQYPLGNLVADAARAMGNADFGMWNNGGIRTDVPAGALLYGGVHEISPFGNVLVRLRLSGATMRTLLERVIASGRPNSHVSGVLVTYNADRPTGQRIVRVTLANGAPLDDARVYTLIVNDFMVDDADTVQGLALVATEFLSVRDIDALAGYFSRLPQPIRADTVTRIRDLRSTGSP